MDQLPMSVRRRSPYPTKINARPLGNAFPKGRHKSSFNSIHTYEVRSRLYAQLDKLSAIQTLRMDHPVERSRTRRTLTTSMPKPAQNLLSWLHNWMTARIAATSLRAPLRTSARPEKRTAEPAKNSASAKIDFSSSQHSLL